jgi:hypothetical protein
MTDQEPVIRQIVGLDELLKDIADPTWLRNPTRRLLERWANKVQRETVANFERGPGGWIDTAETRKSVTHETDPGDDPFPTWTRVGSNRDQFRWGEYGTGLLSEDPESSHRRHWPPGDALQEWAIKHGFEDTEGSTAGMKVARIIGLRGGIEPRRYLREAVATVDESMESFLSTWKAEVEAEAEKSRGTG